MGTPEFSVPSLEELIRNKFNILAVYTQPPKKSKRGQKINVSSIEEFSKNNKLNIKNPMYFVNPEIITKSKNNFTYEEGCLSVPGQFAEIDRPDKCHIKYLDYYGSPKNLWLKAYLQHVSSTR